ncbi:VWA domain-containing protein [Jiangella sp. DSM 45060]|uniref:vWA domain-containing protein n=1 Tax=Jiangella sp. DSM 45060 TaxID=1798224 RepID=UPI000879F0D9|nr:VWA domain-containing protein [Jiangella sp. DSM 45060]SDT02929.1 Ca-activated chloride channel family protein [Jiangella sp. DSM 45060]
MRRPVAATAAAAALAVVVNVAVGVAAGAAPARAQSEEPIDPGSRMVLVLDSSGSMAEATADGSTRIDAAKDALRQVIAGLPDDQEVGLRVYGAEVFSQNDPGACTDSQLIVQPATGNRDQLTSALDGYEPYGETPIGYALQEAGKDIGTEGPRTIVLVSDGEPTCAPDPCEVATQLSGDGIDVRIDVVGLDVTGEAREQLRCVAENGNGTYYDAKDADDLVRSLDVSTTRASRPFDLTGTPIQGTALPADAPTITTGQYLDTFPLEGGLWYRVERTAPNSTIHVGITHRSIAFGAMGDWVSVSTHYAGDDPGSLGLCAEGSSFPLGTLGYTSTTSWVENADNPCNTADVVYVEVAPQKGDLSAEPVEIVVYEEPPLADPTGGDLFPRPPEPAWTPIEPGEPVTDVVPGTSISNAPVVSDGTYAFDINLGETQVVAIPLDWGQNLQAQFDSPLPTGEGLATHGPTVQISGPIRDSAMVDFLAREPENWTGGVWGAFPEGTTSYAIGAQTQTVGYLNRNSGGGASLPGLRYVQVSFDTSGDPLPYTLTLKTNGTAGEGAPEYAGVDGLTPPATDAALVSGAGGDDEDGATPGADPTPGDDATEEQALTGDGGGSELPWTSIGLGAAGVLALAGAGWLVRRSRTTSTP